MITHRFDAQVRAIVRSKTIPRPTTNSLCISAVDLKGLNARGEWGRGHLRLRLTEGQMNEGGRLWFWVCFRRAIQKVADN